MKVTQITVSRTIQLRQYEPCQISATADIAEGASAVGESFELLEMLRALLFEASGRMRGDLAPSAPSRRLPMDLGEL